MVNGVIVVSPEADVFSCGISSGGNHVDALKKYLEENQLTYNGYEDDYSYTMSLYLANINHLVISVENSRYCYYLGDGITTLQEKWYKNNRRSLKRFSCAIVNINEGEVEFYDDYNMDSRECFFKLDEIISEKKIVRDIGINNSKV